MGNAAVLYGCPCCGSCCNLYFFLRCINVSTGVICSATPSNPTYGRLILQTDTPDCIGKTSVTIATNGGFSYRRNDAHVNFFFDTAKYRFMMCNGAGYYFSHYEVRYRCAEPGPDAPGTVLTYESGSPILNLQMKSTGEQGQVCPSCAQVFQLNNCGTTSGIACVTIWYIRWDQPTQYQSIFVDGGTSYTDGGGYTQYYNLVPWQVSIPDVNGKSSGIGGFDRLVYPCYFTGQVRPTIFIKFDPEPDPFALGQWPFDNNNVWVDYVWVQSNSEFDIFAGVGVSSGSIKLANPNECPTGPSPQCTISPTIPGNHNGVGIRKAKGICPEVSGIGYYWGCPTRTHQEFC